MKDLDKLGDVIRAAYDALRSGKAKSSEAGFNDLERATAILTHASV